MTWNTTDFFREELGEEPEIWDLWAVSRYVRIQYQKSYEASKHRDRKVYYAVYARLPHVKARKAAQKRNKRKDVTHRLAHAEECRAYRKRKKTAQNRCAGVDVLGQKTV